MEFKLINLRDCTPSPTNPRRQVDVNLEELIESIKSVGVIEPIIVRVNPKFKVNGKTDLTKPKYEVVCGHRRYHASELAKAEVIPAIIRELSDEEVLEIQITENLQRSDVNPMDEAIAFKYWSNERKTSISEIAHRVGKSESYVAQRLKLNDLIDVFQDMVYEDKITLTSAYLLSKLNSKAQESVYEKLSSNNNMRKPDFVLRLQKDDWVIRTVTCNLSEAPFDANDTSLLPSAGSCLQCPSNSACNTVLFPEFADDEATCTDLSCYEAKYQAHLERMIALAKEQNTLVVTSSMKVDATMLETKVAIKSGVTVIPYSDYHRVCVPEKPEAPNKSEYFEDDDFYDTEEEKQEAYNDALEEYKEELEQYELDLEEYNSTEAITALMLDGERGGQMVKIVLNSSRTSTQSVTATAKEVAECIKEGTATPEMLAAEIERIKTAELRKREIEETQLLHWGYDQLDKSKAYKGNSAELVKQEQIGLLVVLHKQYGYSIRAEIAESFGFKDNWFDEEFLYEYLQSATDDVIQRMLNMYMREMIHNHIKILDTSFEKHAESRVLLNLIDLYLVGAPEKHSDMLKKRDTRNKSTTSRIADLENQLTKLNTEVS